MQNSSGDVSDEFLLSREAAGADCVLLLCALNLEMDETPGLNGANVIFYHKS